MDGELVDRIYETSLVPELWPEVLDAVATVAEGRATCLFITAPNVQYWTASPVAQEKVERFVNEGWFWRGEVAKRNFAARHPGFLIDLDLFTREELAQEPIYRDIWSQWETGWGAMTAVPTSTGENVSFVLTRRIKEGPFERAAIQRLDELRPHLARSGLMAARLQLERARMAAETLAALGIPALVLDDQSKVIAANDLAQALNVLHWRAFDRISLKDKAAGQLLSEALATIDISGPVWSFPVRDENAEALMVAHIIPIRLSAHDIFVRCTAALVLTPVTRPEAPPVELVQSLFDLTPAEAKVARGLASGKTVDDLATDGKTSLNTIRTHVRCILEKTGCHRQTEVIALLTAISPARLVKPA
ncbi:MAG TPA: LuxR C-terminal-related transcriptional regulator [Methylocella sp.]|nr:LuxR C-terminal-related transcriptional regulator [Methylocella sp.]